MSNSLIKKGYKAKAINILNIVLATIKASKLEVINFLKKTEMFYNCVLYIRPLVYAINVKKRRKTVSIPLVTRKKEQIKRSLFWIKQSNNSRKERNLVERLYNELLECFEGTGNAVKRKFEFNDIAVMQRPFLHILSLLK